MHQNNKTANTIFQDRIRIFSFVLTVLVIWIHAVEPGFAWEGHAAGSGSLYRILQSLLGSYLGQVAVPGFFCMSGYLFFRNGVPPFSAKLKSRARTLLIPYVLWNIVYYIIYMIAGRAEPGARQLADAVLNYRFNPVFWYLKELIIITVLTPLIYIFIKNKKAALFSAASVFAAACVYDRLPFHLVNEDALFYYMTGAALALHAGWSETDKRSMKALFGMGITGFLLCDLLNGSETAWIMIAGAIMKRICGVLGLFAAVSLASDRMPHTGMPWYMKYNFFVYAVHYLEIRLFRSALYCAFSGSVPDIAAALLYAVMPVLCIALSGALGGAAKRIVPGVYYIFTGGRS